MSQHREEHLELCAAWALGSIDEADRQRLDRHMAEGCPVCEAACADFSGATTLLAASAPAATPSPVVRERVLAAIAAGGDGRARSSGAAPVAERGRVVEMPRRGSAIGAWASGAIAAALAVASAFMWTQSKRLETELQRSRTA